jgi:hypothetical protein
MNEGKEKYGWIIQATLVFGFLTAVLTFLNSLSSSGFWDTLFELIKQRPHLLWIRVALVYISANIVIFAIIWFSKVHFFSEVIKIYKERQFLFIVRLFGVIFVQILFILIILLAFHEDRSPEAKTLFPQGEKYGPLLIRTYAANGKVNYSFSEETPLFGPKGYAKIRLKTYGKSEEQNCGWVLFLLKGVDLTRYKQLRFKIRGEKGNEAIGVKAKDARGIEVSLLLENYYLSKSKITTDWQQVTIPLDHFGRVDFGLMDNFSIFTNGRIAGTRPQTIYIGEFELL